MYKDTYKGEFNDAGVRHGKGVLEWSNSDVYDGEFKNGMRHGFGVYEDKLSKQVYTGSWISSMKECGTIQYANGDTYEGSFHNDQFCFYGVLKTKTSTYKGYFENGKKNGHGLLCYNNPDRGRYEGDFVNNLPHGHGRYIWPSTATNDGGKRYTGGWENGERCGYGMMVLHGGDGHEGYYLHNKMDGIGWWKKNGRYREGIWKQDELIQWLGVEQARKIE